MISDLFIVSYFLLVFFFNRGSNPPLGSFNIIPTKPKDVQPLQSPQPSTLSPIPFHVS